MLIEFYTYKFVVHPSSTKLYKDLKCQYKCLEMKVEVAEFVSKYLTCQQIKLEHQSPFGELQSLPIAERKWEHVIVDIVTELPETHKGHNTIPVIIDCLMKSAHFLPMKIDNSFKELSQLCISEIVRLNGVLLLIVSDQHSQTLSFGRNC